MADYLLDTNHLSRLVTLDHPLRSELIRRRRLGDTFAIAVPALAEMLYGILVLPRAKQNFQEWQRYREYFDYYAIDRADAEQAVQLQLDLRRAGKQLNTIDALIATIALRYTLTLLTTDQDFYAIAELPCENWLV